MSTSRPRARRIALAAAASLVLLLGPVVAVQAAAADPVPMPDPSASATPSPDPVDATPAPQPDAPSAPAARLGAIAPVASYSFDADNGKTVKDSSGNGNDAAWVGAPSYVPGVGGTAAVVSLGANYVKLPLIPGRTDGSGSFSYEFWIAEQRRTSYGTLMSNQDFDSCNNPGITLYNRTTQGVLQSCWGTTPGGTKRYLDDASPNIDNSWHHVAMTVDRTRNTVTIYTDGVATATSPAGYVTAATVLKSGLAFNIGGLSGSESDSADGYTNAYIDNLSFYDAALPAAQIADDYAAQKPAGGQYIVAFDGNGAGGGSTPAQALAAGQAVPLTKNGFTRPGYQFQGWATSPTGQVAYTDGQSVTDLASAPGATVQLYAVWSRLRAPGDTVAPFASYDFETDSGTTVRDSSGRGNDATWSGAPSYGDGTKGKAAYVNSPAGSKQGVNFFSLPLVAGRTDGSGSFSYAFWLKEVSSSSDSPIVSNQDFTHCYNRGTTLYNTAGKPGILRGCFGQNGASTAQNYLPDASASSVIGAWHHVAVVADRSAGTMTIYLDGEQAVQNKNLTSAFSLNSGYPFRVGAEGSGKDLGDGFVNAYIDNFDFYDQAIPAAQVRNDFSATRPGAVVGDGSTIDRGFVSGVLRAPAVRAGGAVAQPVGGLWNGGAVTSYKKVDGDDWLSVSADGVVSGTAPVTAPDVPGYLTVEATDGTTTSRIAVEVPVLAKGAAVPVDAVTWNMWDAGSHVNDSTFKNLAVIAANGFDLIGLQQDGGTGAQVLAAKLGWHAIEGPGGVGILSPYPLSGSVAPDAARAAADPDAAVALAAAPAETPAVGATVDLLGRTVRVWSLGLDATARGPETACIGGVSDPAALAAAEKSSVRYAQIDAAATSIAADTTAAKTVPVIVLSDLESASGADWTSATAGAHCGVGPVAWPVPARLESAGLADSFRVANPDPAAVAGNTWSPVVPTNGTTGGAEPQDRIDYVHYAGAALSVLGSNTLVAGWPSPRNIAGNAWTSNHRAVVTSFALAAEEDPGTGGPDAGANGSTGAGANGTANAGSDAGADSGGANPGGSADAGAAGAGSSANGTANGGAGASGGASSSGSASGTAEGSASSASSGSADGGSGSGSRPDAGGKPGDLAITGGLIAVPIVAAGVALLALGVVLVIRHRRRTEV